MIYIVDGTGPDDDAKYNADMTRGFCSHINNQIKNSVYFRGPNISGLTTWQIADCLFENIIIDVNRAPSAPIILVGHSRGGSACIYIARKLKNRGVKVRALILFDAVRRAIQHSPEEYFQKVISGSHGAPLLLGVLGAFAAVDIALDYFQIGNSEIDKIPSNVEIALHVTRNEDFSNYFINCLEWKNLTAKISDATKKGKACDVEKLRLKRLLQFHKNLRDACRFNCIGPLTGLSTGFGFANTGLSAESGCRLLPIIKNTFMASHGAMGGAPIRVSSYIDDASYAALIESQEIISMLGVQCRVNGFLKEIGVYGEIKLDYVPATFSANQSQTAIK